MTEHLLQYLWQHRLFTTVDFQTVDGNPLEILDFGKWNLNAGPDFSNGKIRYKGLLQAGQIELHVRSSDWHWHHHDADQTYNNVILHVVYEHDTPIPSLVARGVPTLELKKFIKNETLEHYENFQQNASFVACEKIFQTESVPFLFAEEQLLAKLNAKATELEKQLAFYKYDYEAVLFHTLAYAFGLKINAEMFLHIATHIDFSIFKKVRQNRTQTEILLLGLANLLHDAADPVAQEWQTEFSYLQQKYSLPPSPWRPLFNRLRPPNFPTLRLSQLAHLFSSQHALFATLMQAKHLNEMYDVLQSTTASAYWDTRYTFVGSPAATATPKKVTRDFVDRVIINAVLPMRYTYRKNEDENAADDILHFYEAMAPEKNTVIDGWKALGVRFDSAVETQAWLHHYKHFCSPKNCLQCSIGLQLLKK